MNGERTSLAQRSADFAAEVQACLDGTLPGEREMIARADERGERFIVQPRGDSAVARRIPILVDGAALGALLIRYFLTMDRSSRYLKVVGSNIVMYADLDRTPLFRLDYRSDMHTAPVAHWQVHAERGALSHLLSRAHQHRPDVVEKPHAMSSLHLPVGGDRFRPCLEDVVQFLVVDCGVDHRDGWHEVVDDGRERWRRRQVGAAVRDAPDEAVRVLDELGWSVTRPAGGAHAAVSRSLRRW